MAGKSLKSAVLSCGDWRLETTDQINNLYGGAWQPFTTYTVTVEATGTSGETGTAQAQFATGRLDTPWLAEWITDMSVTVPEKSSPVPLTFRKTFTAQKQIKRAWINATALGVYELAINGQKVG